MKFGKSLCLLGAAVLVALAGCGRSFLSGEREPWRREAEIACLKSGAVKLGATVVRAGSIEGPGICGADFPLKVAALGESTLAIGYADDVRPPAAIPNSSTRRMPSWPTSAPGYGAPSSVGQVPAEQHPTQPRMRWVPGPPPARIYDFKQGAGAPMTLNPQGVSIDPPGAAPLPDDIPDDAMLPSRDGRATHSPATSPAALYQGQPRQAPVIGRGRASQAMAPMTPAVLTPAATLACPIVSALDHWVAEGIQPAALRWFGTQVVEVKQISAYACRSMVGAGTSHISEHAFGNAIDIAAFTLADGRHITVQEGWHGTPEEQGFLHDVQFSACNYFNTVLAPGYNAAHYNHIHVDLMRRASGERPCRPEPVAGEIAAAKARASYARKRRVPAYTGSVFRAAGTPQSPPATPGADGYVREPGHAEIPAARRM
ncbi:MAG TPA: extensin family protein [Pseudolabrys sp.]|nr:extensin family protein [Pseudolabrys sp.]